MQHADAVPLFFINLPKMKLIHITSSLIAVSVATATREFTDIAEIDQAVIWNKFQAAFGEERVKSAYSSSASLVSAIVSEDEAATHIGCSVSYEYGAELADELREQDNSSSVFPFFVSPEDDTICFTLPANAPEFPSLQFQMAYPSSLKVHDSITNAVSSLMAMAEGSEILSPTLLDTFVAKLRNGTAGYQRLQLSVSLVNSASKFRDAVGEAIDQPMPLIALIQTLREYKTALLEKFYFVAPVDFSALSVSEKARVQTWRKARDALLEHLHAHDSAGRVLSPDPCGLRQAVAHFIRDNLTGSDPAHSFDLSDMAAMGNASLASGCLAFVTAAIAQHTLTMQVSLSTRSV